MLQNILKYTLWTLFVITAILVVLFYIQVVPLPDTLAQMDHGTTNAILGWALGLFVVCALAAVAFPVYEFIKQLIEKPAGAMKTLIMLGAVAVICVIAYVTASGSFDSISETLVETNEAELKWSGAGLNALYISLGVALIAVLYAEIAKKFFN